MLKDFRGAIPIGANFYLNENEKLMVNVTVSLKGKIQDLNMQVNSENDLKLKMLIDDIFKFNIEKELL